MLVSNTLQALASPHAPLSALHDGLAKQAQVMHEALCLVVGTVIQLKAVTCQRKRRALTAEAQLPHATWASTGVPRAAAPRGERAFCAVLGSFASQFLYAEIFTIGHV